jgi:hypothetical protein
MLPLSNVWRRTLASCPDLPPNCCQHRQSLPFEYLHMLVDTNLRFIKETSVMCIPVSINVDGKPLLTMTFSPAL